MACVSAHSSAARKPLRFELQKALNFLAQGLKVLVARPKAVGLELLRVEEVELLFEQHVLEARLRIVDLLILVSECLLRRKVQCVVSSFKAS